MEQLTLFDDRQENIPLASRVRPASLEEFAGQKHLLGPGKMLRQLIERDQISSMIFWGPPGVGKTTLASIIAGRTKANFINFSAVTSGIKEIKEVMNQAEAARRMGERTVLFVDEIHRFNKAQQDAFLPFVEKGSIILIGATTENPSFEVNAALLSRCKVFVLKALEEDDLVQLLYHALKHPKGFADQNVKITERQVRMIAAFANGDARTALNTLEMAVLNGEIGQQMLADIQTSGSGLVGLAYYDAGARNFYTVKPVRSLEDMKGLKIRLQNNAMMVEMAELLGANGVTGIGPNDVYSAIQQGTIDGAENNWPTYESMGDYEAAPYFTLDAHTRVPEILLASEAIMNTLSEEDQQLIKECAKETQEYEIEQWNLREKSAEEKVTAAGVEVIELSAEELAKFQERMAPLYTKYGAGYEDIIASIQNDS